MSWKSDWISLTIAHVEQVCSKIAHKPRNREGLNREVQSSRIPVFQFTSCS